MTGFIGPGGDPGDYFARFFGGGPDRPAHIDFGRLLTQQARELLSAAGRHCAERGCADLDTDHLLWALTQQEPTRTWLMRTGADPEALARQRRIPAAGRRRQRLRSSRAGRDSHPGPVRPGSDRSRAGRQARSTSTAAWSSAGRPRRRGSFLSVPLVVDTSYTGALNPYEFYGRGIARLPGRRRPRSWMFT